MRGLPRERRSGAPSAAQQLSSAALPFVLSVIAGSTDTIGFLGLNGLFTAHITGNLVILAAHIVIGNPATLSYMLAVPVFMLVLLLSRLLADWLDRRDLAPLRTLLLLQLLLLVAFIALCTARSRGTLFQSGIGGDHFTGNQVLAYAEMCKAPPVSFLPA